VSLRDRIAGILEGHQFREVTHEETAEAILSDPEIAALRDVAENTRAYRWHAKTGHHRDCGYWRKEATCSCLIADTGAACDAALARLEEARR
jgi:hypothetical protein